MRSVYIQSLLNLLVPCYFSKVKMLKLKLFLKLSLKPTIIERLPTVCVSMCTSVCSLQYLQTLHLQSSDLLDVFGGISFFPLDKMTYLKIQSFVNRVEESLSLIKYTAFLYNDQLIWYRLNTTAVNSTLESTCWFVTVCVITSLIFAIMPECFLL